ncbi:MAG: polynucleotide kinase-phosphatase [Chloroflexota bacterium]
MKIEIPELALVVLVGVSGSGKSTFARTHFLPTETISSDVCRGLISDDDNNQAATNDAFDLLHYIAAKRLTRGRLTVIDATNGQAESRRKLIRLAKEHHVLPIAIVLNLRPQICFERNQTRADRNFGFGVVKRQHNQLRNSLRRIKREGFNRVFTLNSPEEIADVSISRTRLWNNRKDERGPFDIIGDIHGCCDELEILLDKLGYVWNEVPQEASTYHRVYRHENGRKAVFLGDLGDRGPRILDSFQLVRNMVNAGHAICVPGNHDAKLIRKLRGKKVKLTHGLEDTMAEIDALPDDIRATFSENLREFLYKLTSHYVLDRGKLVVAHAGLKEAFQGRSSGKVRSFALYGDTTGETDEFGLPVRLNWAADYRGAAMVVYGHTPVPEAEWLNKTINIDTGCVFGGKLTALRYPERELVSVPAQHVYAESARPNFPPAADETLTAQQQHDDLLDLADITGKRIVNTRLRPNITLLEENSITALEVMSRFAINPKWLIYLPPTMSPTETSELPNMLEHPTEAFSYFAKASVDHVICEEKHMGSRAIVIVGKDAAAIEKRFGIPTTEAGLGVVYTRTGRRFFADVAVETAVLTQLQQSLTAINFWERLNTEWVCLDCELMPWSAKAQALLRGQYAAVGSAGQAALLEVNAVLKQALQNGVAVNELAQTYATHQQQMASYISAYGRYCWPVQSVDDLRLAPFHIMATEGAVHSDKPHTWHMELISELTSGESKLLMPTQYRQVDLNNEASVAAAVQWWEELTAVGGEGMVIKPLDFVAYGDRGLIQPALKCRGKEYLRIIYGPEYDTPEQLAQLKNRHVRRKRSLALREFALGVEGLKRFVNLEPLRRVHECVFGVMALESEAVDPRL